MRTGAGAKVRRRLRSHLLIFPLSHACAALAATALLATGCVAPQRLPGGALRLAGAQIPVELVESWLRDARSYSFAPTQVMPVYMSMHGFEHLAQGECDLACTDRPITSRERERFGETRVGGRRIAFYGYALYVHPSNPLDALTAKAARLVFQRKVQDWKQLVGEEVAWEGPIALYGPPKGTRGGGVLAPLAKIWFADATWEEVPTDAEIVARVAADPLALGFASIGYDQEARYLGLRMDRAAAPAFPSLEEIENERYGLAKVIYVYHLEPLTDTVAAALEYLGGPEGQAAIERTNLWPVAPERAEAP